MTSMQIEARKSGHGLYFVLVSVHGLTRGHHLELGRDADTGGQTKYVIELARALAEHPEVERVDLLTRQVIDPKVDPDYAEPFEQLTPKARIVRLPCGPRRYLRKEVLWPYVDGFTDAAIQHIRNVGRVPDVIHSHYADAGHIGAHLASLLGVPLVHTGHSLGRDKRQRLLAQGMKPETVETHYNISRRIEAEEYTLDIASRVVASTRQEIKEQYPLYDNYQPKRMIVIPPGVEIGRFHPPKRDWPSPPIYKELERFLREPRKPIILALSRADVRKNITTLVKAYGENHRLRDMANLVMIVGNRDDPHGMGKEPKQVLRDFLLLVDKYDLYGNIAYPTRHEPNDVPDLYRLAAKSRGLFVNPALTEPFGLTIVEAAASGLPVVATRNGGPSEIIANCKNGVLIDPLDSDRLGDSLLEALSDLNQWRRWSKNGASGAHKHYSWRAHTQRYVREVQQIIRPRRRQSMLLPAKSRLTTVDRLVVCDVDNTLLGDKEALQTLLGRLQEDGQHHIALGVATGRSIASTRKILKEWNVPLPDLLICSVGTEIYYGPQHAADTGWQRHIDYRWQPEAVREAMERFPGLRLQPKAEQARFKISYFVDPAKAPSVREIVRFLRRHDLHANVAYSLQAYLDITPMRASKGAAIRYFANKWGLPIEHVLVAGDSGSDEDMLLGNTLGVVVGNYSPELRRLRHRPRIYFAKGHYAWGIVEGMDYYNFLGPLQQRDDIDLELDRDEEDEEEESVS